MNEFEKWFKDKLFDKDFNNEIVPTLRAYGFDIVYIIQDNESKEIFLEDLTIKEVGILLKVIAKGPETISNENLQKLIDKKYIIKYEFKDDTYFDMLTSAIKFFNVNRGFLDELFGEDDYYFYLQLHDEVPIYKVKLKRTEGLFIRNKKYKDNKNIKNVFCLTEKTFGDKDTRKNYMEIREKVLMPNATFKITDIKTFKEKLNGLKK